MTFSALHEQFSAKAGQRMTALTSLGALALLVCVTSPASAVVTESMLANPKPQTPETVTIDASAEINVMDSFVAEDMALEVVATPQLSEEILGDVIKSGEEMESAVTIPEPAAAAILIAGLGSMAFMRYRLG